MMHGHARSEPMSSSVGDDQQTHTESNCASKGCAERSSFRECLPGDLIKREKEDNVSGDHHRVESIVYVDEPVGEPRKEGSKTSKHDRRCVYMGEEKTDGDCAAHCPDCSSNVAADGIGESRLQHQ